MNATVTVVLAGRRLPPVRIIDGHQRMGLSRREFRYVLDRSGLEPGHPVYTRSECDRFATALGLLACRREGADPHAGELVVHVETDPEVQEPML